MSDAIIRITVNGVEREFALEHNVTLADALRDQARTTSVHQGCEHGVCGACNVYLDGQVVRSCLTLAAACDGASVTTLEGLNDATATALKAAMHEHHGLQCGFCTPGMVITGHDMLKRGLCQSEPEIRQQLCGNICRCTGYQGIVRAIAHTREEIKS
jgi:carbon-monoxide dehydrogenase small subunit